MLASLAAQSPAEPSRPAHFDVHRHLLTRRQPLQRSQAPVIHRQRHALAVRAKRVDVHELATQRLHLHHCERGRVARECHTRPLERCHHQRDEHQHPSGSDAEQHSFSAVHGGRRVVMQQPKGHPERIEVPWAAGARLGAARRSAPHMYEPLGVVSARDSAEATSLDRRSALQNWPGASARPGSFHDERRLHRSRLVGWQRAEQCVAAGVLARARRTPEASSTGPS